MFGPTLAEDKLGLKALAQKSGLSRCGMIPYMDIAPWWGVMDDLARIKKFGSGATQSRGRWRAATPAR